MSIITLTEFKVIKGINSASKDAQHQAVIDAANSYIHSYCNRAFDVTIINTEYFNAEDLEIYPKEYPLEVVTSVKTSTDGGQNYDVTLVEYTDYMVDKTNSRIISLSNNFVDTLIDINAIEVVYTGGFTTIPPDLILAAANLVDYYVDEQYTPGKALAGASVDNIITVDMTGRLPGHIRRVLDHYRALEL